MYGGLETRRQREPLGALGQKEGQHETKANKSQESSLTHSHTSSWKVWIGALTLFLAVTLYFLSSLLRSLLVLTRQFSYCPSHPTHQQAFNLA